MRLPFLWLAIALTLGLLAAERIPLKTFELVVVLIVLMPLAALAIGRRIFIPILFASLMIWAAVDMRWNSWRPANAIEKTPYLNNDQPLKCFLKGRVVSVPEEKIYGRKRTVSFVVESFEVTTGSREFRQRSRVTGKVQTFLFQPGEVPECGDQVDIRILLEKPRSLLNPGGFDYQNYLARQNIFLIGKAYGKHSVRIKKSAHRDLLSALLRFRSFLKSEIRAKFDPRWEKLFAALILGERKSLPDALLDDFRKTGTLHLIAISGLNITLFAGTFYCLMLICRMPQKGAALIALMLTIIQAVISGLEYSVIRAALMASVGFAAFFFERQRHGLNTLFLVYSCMILIEPKCLFHIGFQLSFLSVLCLMIFFSHPESFMLPVEGVASTVAVTFGTLPIVIRTFSMIAPVSILANLLAIPLFHLSLLSAIFALSVARIPWIGCLSVRISEQILTAAMAWIQVCAHLPYAYFHVVRPGMLQILIYYLCFIILILLWKMPLKDRIFIFSRKTAFAFCAAVWAGVAVSFFWPLEAKTFQGILFSAGKNDLFYFQLEGTHWVVNTGRGLPSSQSRWILEPYLRSQGINRPDGVILTDGSKKHTGGMESMIRNFRPKNWIYNGSLDSKYFSRRGPFHRIQGREVWAQGGSEIILYPIHQKELFFLVKTAKWKLLYLPNLSGKVLQVLKEYKREFHGVEILVIADPSNRSLSSWDEILSMMDPSAILAPFSDPLFLQEAAEREIRVFDAEKGAIKMDSRPQQKLRKELLPEEALRSEGRNWVIKISGLNRNAWLETVL